VIVDSVFAVRKLVCALLMVLGVMVWAMAGLSVFYPLWLSAYLILLIMCLPLLFRNLQWFEPVIAVNAMFLIFALDLLYLSISGFSHAEHLLHTFPDIVRITTPAMLYASGWLLLFTTGYALIRKVPQKISPSDPLIPLQEEGSRRWKVVVAICCIAVGLANLLYNIWLFSPDAPLSYLLRFGVAQHREQVNPGWFTTLGYNFFIVGLILYRTSVRRWGWRKLLCYMLFLAVTLVAILSRGQIFFTFSVVIFLYVFECFISTRRRLLVTMGMVLAPALILLVLFAYAMRLVSVELFLAAQSGQSLNFWPVLIDKFSNMAHLIFGKGNVPNLPAMLVYWDHYNGVEGWLNGRSMVSWLNGFIPGFSGSFIGYNISDLWYPNNVGGVPPGVMFEFYANFGLLAGWLAAIVLGALSAAIFNQFMARRTLILGIVYAALLTRFWFILPKVEMATLNNAIWLFAPTVLVLLAMSFGHRIILRQQGFRVQ